MLTGLPTRRFPALAPWREIDGFENRLRRMFGEALGETEALGWAPAVDVVETDDELKLTAELPGVGPEDVEIELEGNMLTIRGEKKLEREETKAEGRARVFERVYGEFSRSFTVPAAVDPEKITAEFQNGVLMVHMPKTTEAKGRRIEVHAKK